MYILMDTNTLKNWPPKFWFNNRKSENDINPIARGLYCWGFSKGLKCSKYLPDSDCYWDVTNTETRMWDQTECLKYPVGDAHTRQIILFQRYHAKIKLAVNLLKLAECHLREGYMIQGTEFYELVSAVQHVHVVWQVKTLLKNVRVMKEKLLLFGL